MKPTEHTTAPNTTTGLFATLRGLLRAKGTGAPSSTTFSKGTSARSLTPSALRASIQTPHREVHPTLGVSPQSQGASSPTMGMTNTPSVAAADHERSWSGRLASLLARIAAQGRRGSSRSRTQALKCAGRNGDASRRRVSSRLRYMKGRGQRYAPAIVVLVALAAPCAASAAQTPWWHLTSNSRPTYLPPACHKVAAGTGKYSDSECTELAPGAKGEFEKGIGQLVVGVANLGDATAHGECRAVPLGTGRFKDSACTEAAEPGQGEFEQTPIVITDTLPEGLRVTAVESQHKSPPSKCSHKPVEEHEVLTCKVEAPLAPYGQLELIVDVAVEESAHTGELNQVSVSGGGAPVASIERPITVSAAPTPFGVSDYEVATEEEGGSLDTQAASHPFQTTFTVALTQSVGEFSKGLGLQEALPAALAKDLRFRLPAGLIGNPTPFARCTLAQFFHKPKPTCQAQTVLGVAVVTFDEPGILGLEKATVPIYNIEPQTGEPARFAFLPVNTSPVFIDTAVRSGQDYSVEAIVNNITQAAALISSETVFWGVPGDPRHDSSRGEDCLENKAGCQPLEASSPPPFFELPSACVGPLQSTVQGDAWIEPLAPEAFPTLASTTLPAIDGCNRLPFAPSIRTVPDGTAASSPTGLTVDVHNPQQESLNAEGLGEADVRGITVALPEGVAVNPSGGDGLLACTEGLAGFTGFTEFLPGDPSATFTPSLPEPEESGVNVCPNAAKIGEATIKTPLLQNPVKGFVYLATQNQNPFGSLIAMYIVAKDPVSGVVIKLTGAVHLTESGQLVTTFENNPQAPFEDAELHFFGGERAPLTTPSRCGAYTTTASFTPWSQEPGEEPHTASSTFDINAGPNGTPCPGASLPFSPQLTGGTTNINAGGFSPLTTTISRADGQQNMQQVTLHMPAGLEGLLSNVKLCPEAQANEGTCGPESQIGETTVAAGVGSDPVSVKGGKVYITEKYAGAPFGLSIVNPVKAGPFDLEHDTVNPAQQPAM